LDLSLIKEVEEEEEVKKNCQNNNKLYIQIDLGPLAFL